MDIYSIIVIVGLAACLLLGYLLGFGKSLRFLTGGLVGIAFSVIFCVMFGGMIASIPFISDLIARGNEYFGGFAEILSKLNIATWIFYVVLFLLVQIVRKIIVKIIDRIFTPHDKGARLYGARNVINRVLGLILFGAIFILAVYLVMAVLALLTDIDAIADMLAELEGNKWSLFYKMYINNPIDFTVLFG